MPAKKSKKHNSLAKKQYFTTEDLQNPYFLGGIVIILLAITFILLLITYFASN